MAQTNFTPISLYYSATATNVPSAANLVAGELAINTADGKLFYKDSAGVVQVIGTKGGVGSSTNTQILYNSSGLVVGSANLTFSGSQLTLGGNQVISVTDNSNAALRITQLGTGNALLVEDSTNPDSTPFVVASDGKVLVGTTASVTTGVGVAAMQILGGNLPLSFYRAADSTTPINLEFAKSRAGGAVVASGDTIGRLYFSGSDGTAQIPAAYIDAAVDGTPGTNDMPGRLVFSTTADGGSTPTERMRITSAGEVLVGGSTSLNAKNGALSIQNDAGNDYPVLNLFRDDTTVSATNPLGRIQFYGNDTTSNTPTILAYIEANPSGAHSAGDNPTDIVFATTPDGTETVAEAVRIKDGGGLQISRTAVTAPATGDGNVFSGTYTPTQVSTNTNVDAVTFSAGQYMRVGSTVTVSGLIQINPTSAATQTVVKFSLPIASAFSGSFQLGGTGSSSSSGFYGTVNASFMADTTNDCVEMRLLPTFTTLEDFRFHFTYRIV
jgi:hypothetical protein